jgi:hypothetical protein
METVIAEVCALSKRSRDIHEVASASSHLDRDIAVANRVGAVALYILYL